MASRRPLRPRVEELEHRTVPSASLVTDIRPGSSPSNALIGGREGANVSGELFFAASDGTHGTELWKTDGTAAGTAMVDDIYPGVNPSGPSDLVNVNGTLFFAAKGPSLRIALWKSDGTAAGTVLVADTDLNSSSFPANLTNVNGTLFFSANDSNNVTQLWKSTGTGATLVDAINTGSNDNNPGNFTNVNGTLFFTFNDGTHGYEVWKSDGTAAGTALVADVNPATGTSGAPGNLTSVNGKLFFTADDGTHGNEVWESDGTTAGTVMVDDITPGAGISSDPRYLTNVSGTLFFSAIDGSSHGRELWKSDGSAAGTVLVDDINPGATGSYPRNFTNVNGTLLFVDNDGTHGYELWKSDGTPAGTALVKDIYPGTSGGNGNYVPHNLTNVNGTLFFVDGDTTTGAELWESNGTAAGTVLVADINPGATSSNPINFVAVGSTLFFGADDGTHGAELWEATSSAPDTTGANITAAAFSGTAPSTFDTVKLTFSEPMQVSSFTTAEVTLSGPGGAITPTAVTPVSGSTTQFDVTFPVQSTLGTYTVTASQKILDVVGNLMDQNQNGINGEAAIAPAGDQFQGTGTLSSIPQGAHITLGAFTDGGTPGAFVAAVVTFDRAIDPTSFDASDVTLTGPNGAIAVTGLSPDAGTGNTRFTISFAPESTLGNYTMTVGPDILDVAGNQMDQNGNGINGEVPGDQFAAMDTLTPPPLPQFFAVGNNGGTVRIVNSTTGAVITTFRPLDDAGVQYTGLVEVALGDFNGDSIPDVLVAAANPLGATGLDATKAIKVFVYDGASLAAGTVPTTPFRTFTPFTFHDGPNGIGGTYTNGLNIAVGDINGDGTADLIAGTRGGNGSATGGQNEFGRLVVIDGTSPVGSNIVIGGLLHTPFGSGYQKGVVVAVGNIDGVGGDEIAVTRGGPVASSSPTVQQIKVKVLQLQNGVLTELPLSADGTTAFAPFASLSGPAKSINRDGRVAFVDSNGDGKAELVFSALDPLTTPGSEQVRVGVYSINAGASAAAATIVSTGTDAGTYLTGSGVVDHAITHVAAAGAAQNLAIITESASPGVVYLAPLTGTEQTGGFSLSVLHGGITIDGI